MSLFIDALAKRIIYYMKYRDDEISKLTEKLKYATSKINRSLQVCCYRAHNDDRGRYHCDYCDFEECVDCFQEDKWIFMCENYDDIGEIIINVDDKKQDDEDYDVHEENMFCSKECFKMNYNETPVMGQKYIVYHNCVSPSFKDKKVYCKICHKFAEGIECQNESCCYKVCNNCCDVYEVKLNTV
jgi:hypothetical protein